MSRLSVDIGKDPIAKISNVRENIVTFGRDLAIAAEEIVDKLTDDGGNKAVQLNAIAPQTGFQKSVVDFNSKNGKGHISLVGESAVYDEFGTGEKGAEDGHPLKGFYGLNPYNSGPQIHINKNGRHYWFAPKGLPQNMYPNNYTEGSPSGKQMFNTLQYIRQIQGKVVEEKINDVLKQYK